MPYFKNDQVNLLYIHIPKTGGTSLEYYFSQKYNILLNAKSLHMFLDGETKSKTNINTSLQHITYNTIKKYKEELNIDFNNIKIITAVRNPYERLVSDLFYYKKISVNSTKEYVFGAIQSYVVLSDLDNHNLPQYLFITDDNKELIPDIHIMHTETLAKDMHDQGFLDFNIHENANQSKVNYYDYLNDDSIRLINDIYDDDFRIFKYNKIIP